MRSPRRGMRAASEDCPRLPTIRACASRRFAARRACSRRVTPASRARTAAITTSSLPISPGSPIAAHITIACWLCCATRTIPSRSSPKADGTARSSTRRVAARVSATIRIFSIPRAGSPAPSCRSRRRTSARTAARRSERCLRGSGRRPDMAGRGMPMASPSVPRFAALPPLALYLHIPWCIKKCPYCDFNSHERRGAIPETQYVDALIADLEFALPSIWGRRVVSVFFGGGTPSLFSPEAIDRILAAVRARVTVAPDAEITLEANPGTFEQAKFAGFRAAGVNRLSLGVQSFNPVHLSALGRVHDEREARTAAAAAVEIFGNVNLDLMYALPGQTVKEARADVAEALAFATPHLSFYHLTIEPNTLFHRYPPPLPDDDAAAGIGDGIEDALTGAGYRHYETSAFARADRECRHNLNYWQFGDYLGIGAGAHSKLSFQARVLRQVRYKQPQQYLEQMARGEPLLEEREVTRAEIGFEFMLNAMRLTDGVPVALFAERTGFPLAILGEALDAAERRGHIVRDYERMAPTALGKRFLNDLQAMFLPPKSRRLPDAALASIPVRSES